MKDQSAAVLNEFVGVGLGAYAHAATVTRATSAIPQPPRAKPVYTVHSSNANATLLQNVDVGPYYAAQGSRVYATGPDGDGWVTLNFTVGQHTNVQAAIRDWYRNVKFDAQVPQATSYGGYTPQFSALRGLPEEEGLGASPEGLGIPGPYGANPAQAIPAGTYEISGTQVELRDAPGGNIIGQFNGDYGANGNIVAGTPDQVSFDGQTGVANGLTWGHVSVTETGSSGPAGKDGYVALEYLAPVGWTASNGGTGPVPSQPPSMIQPASNVTTTTTTTTTTNWLTDWRTWVIGGAVALGVGILVYAGATSRKGRAVRRLHRIRKSRRGRRR
jgi:hypothetical protein